MRIDGAWIAAPATRATCRMLTESGHQCLFVGGCVRNALLGVAVGDIDLTTDATPREVIALAEAAGLKAVPTGIDHGTVTVVCAGTPFEVTTFREDVETFGRHAIVTFSDNMEADARRRDFTMNALYARPDGTVLDPLGGLGDLRKGRVRFIGEAGRRIQEDYLRILRFFRFHALYGDPAAGLDPVGLAACASHLDGLQELSRERIGTEMRKLLTADDPAPTISAMQDVGVLDRVLPGSDTRCLSRLTGLATGTDTPPDVILRLAALGGTDVADRLRLSKAEARRWTGLRSAATGGMQAAELGYRFGIAEGHAIVLLRAAFLGTGPDPAAREDLARGAAARFPIDARDLMPGYAGERLGARLQELERRWIESGFTLSREDLL